VRLEVEGDVLVVLVEERPAIAKVEFTGTKEFEKDVLVKALKEIGVGEAKIFDKASVDRAEQELKRQYLSHGLYGVKITTTVTPIERNRVNVTFAVDEGDVAKIKQINIVGNKAFSDKELRDQLALNTGGWFSWYTKADQYSKTKLTGDIESLKSFYLIAATSRCRSIRPRCRSRPTRRTSTSRSTSPKARSTRSPASSSKARCSAAKKSSRP
jgi:outer membrane protein insertion porin family